MGETVATHELERRNLTGPVEWRSAGDGDKLGHLGGYAAVFNRFSQNLGGYVENVAPGAFTKTLGEARVLCRLNHKNSALLGTTDAGTLTLTVDDVGLHYDVALPDTTAGRDASVLAQRGDLHYSSFAFICIEEEWGITPDGFPLRTLLQVQLVDVAPVVEPAYLDSTVGLRSLAAHLGMDVATVAEKPTEEIRALLTGETVEPVTPAEVVPPVEAAPEERSDSGPGETHPLVLIEQRRLELDALR